MNFVRVLMLIFLSILTNNVFANCSFEHIGHATLNEVFAKLNGNNNQRRGYLEVKILDSSVTSAVYNTWKVKICTNASCETLPLSSANTSNLPWVYFDKNDFNINLIDFDNGFDLSLIDGSNDFIDYIEVGAGPQDFEGTCSYDDLAYVFPIPGTNSGTKLLNRSPDGIGSWIAFSANNSETPGEGNTPPTNNPYLVVSDDSVMQGEGEHFVISIEDASGVPSYSLNDINIEYKTSDNTAESPTHYSGVSSTRLTIPAGFNSATIPIETILVGDQITRNFNFDLNNPVNAIIGDSRGIGTITPQLLPILDYRLDECSYTGINGDVIDQMGDYSGQSFGNVNTNTDGQIERFTDISNADHHIETSVPLPTNFSVSTWFKKPTSDLGNPIFVLGAMQNGGDLLYIDRNNELKWGVYNGSSSTSGNYSFGSLDGNWHHLTLVYSAGQTQLYIDGILEETLADAPSGTLKYIGTSSDDINSSEAQGFRAPLDEFLVYDEALTAANISVIYNNQLAKKNYDGSIRDAVNCNSIELVAGRVTLNNTADDPSFTHVCFDEPFSVVPVVFSLPNTASNADRLALRIRNVTVNGFDIAQVESPEDANPNPPAGNLPQTVDFLAIVEGDYDLDGGAKMRVSSLATSTFQGRAFSGNSRGWETISTAGLGFTQTPAIIASIQTMNNEPNNANLTGPFPESDPFLATTVRNVTNNAFQIALERGETNSGTIGSDETIGYIAISSGFQGNLTSEITYESFRTGNNITGINTCRSFNLTDSYVDSPLVIASQNTRSGGDGGWLKRCTISTTNVGFSIVEDGDRDMDTTHINERAGGLALGGIFKDFTNSCPSSSIDHFEINMLNGQGLTCEPDIIKLRACSDPSCSILNPDAVDVVLSVSDSMSDVLTKNVTIVGGEIDVEYIHTKAEVVSLSLDQTFECLNGSPTLCDVTFADAGFRFVTDSGDLTLPVQLSGKPSNIGFNADTFKIEAVKTDDATGACAPLLITGESIEMAASYQSPGTGTELVNISGQNIGTAITGTVFDSLPFIAVPLDFGGITQHSAEYIFTYPDAGSVVLNARYELPDDEGNPSGDFIKGTSNPIIVRPFAFDMFIDNNLPTGDTNYKVNPKAQSGLPSNNVFMAAGEDIKISMRAVAWKLGDDDNANGLADEGEDSSTNVTTENFTGIELESLTHTLVEPSSVTPGILTVSDSGNFGAGVKVDTATYDEVGIISLQALTENYIGSGENIEGFVPYVGRFTPHHFTVTLQDNGALMGSCEAIPNADEPLTGLPFVFSGQMLWDSGTSSITTIGALRYFTNLNPEFEIEARNKNDALTKNYVGDFYKLSLTSFARLTVALPVGSTTLAPDTDAVRLGKDDDKLVRLLANINDATLADDNGKTTYTYANSDNFVYLHEENSEINEFTSDIRLSMVSIIDEDTISTEDADGVDTNGIILTLSPTGVPILFGRAQLENSYGPETSPLQQSLSVTYFKDGQYKVAEDDYCTPYNSKEVTITNIDLSSTLPETNVVNGKFITEVPPGETRKIILDAPGVSNTGQVCVSYSILPWLQYKWATDVDNLQCPFTSTDVDGLYNDNPFGIATFGLFRGNDRIIYQREVLR
ncbi:LamG domain-containing protein [Colwellia sp. Bg11-28]|uniref:LamG domain-containing protein n=1 Tax=Colwellia sp. Bg11-28 TaxID=2058305 RepID=UPI000C331271|nr:LamG domain-containing protein [Colwellia sp. Bg11-28]PKH85688.1 hypothetical protein CXF79_20815 [Colwellia sp. Bg11-28]